MTAWREPAVEPHLVGSMPCPEGEQCFRGVRVSRCLERCGPRSRAYLHNGVRGGAALEQPEMHTLYILTPQIVKVHPKLARPAKADSDHNIHVSCHYRPPGPARSQPSSVRTTPKHNQPSRHQLEVSADTKRDRQVPTHP